MNLGFTATTALEMLPKILESSRRRLPDVHVSLIELLPDPLFDALESELIDVAIGRELIDFAQFEVDELFHENLCRGYIGQPCLRQNFRKASAEKLKRRRFHLIFKKP